MIFRKKLLAAVPLVIASIGFSQASLAHGTGQSSERQMRDGGMRMAPCDRSNREHMRQGHRGRDHMHRGHGQMRRGHERMHQGHMGRDARMQPRNQRRRDDGNHRRMQPLREDLSAEDVREIMAGRLEHRGNPNIRLGEVEETSDDMISVEIVTKEEGSLVRRLEVNRHTGYTQPAE